MLISEKIKEMSSREIAEILYTVSMCHIGDVTVFCGNCPIGGAMNCDIDGITYWLVSEVE